MRTKARRADSGDERGIWDSVESQKLIRSKQRKEQNGSLDRSAF